MHALRAVSQVDGRTHVPEKQRVLVGKRHLAVIIIIDKVAAYTHTRAEGESAPAVCPVDVAVHACLPSIEMIGAQQVEAVVSDAAIVGIISFVVVVPILMVGTQAIAHFAILAVGTVVTRIQVEAEARHVGQQMTVLVKVIIHVIETVVVLVRGIPVKSRVQANAKVVSLLIEFLGVVDAEVSEPRPRDGGVANLIVQHAIRHIERLAVDAVDEAVVFVVEASGVKRDVARGVNLIVDVRKEIAAETTVVFIGGVGLVPHRVKRAVLRDLLALHLPTFGMVVAEVIASRDKQIDTPFVLLPHVAHPRRHERLAGAIHAEADELVALDMRRSHDVDDRFGVGGVFGRGVGDGLDTRDGVGRQGLKVSLQVLLGELRRFVVDPNLHARHATQGDIAFHVDFHARRIL